MPDSPTDIEELIFRCLEAREDGGEAAVDALLVSHPELAPRVRRVLVSLAETSTLGSISDAPPPEAEVPTRLGAFRLEQKIGAGGMGIVFRAYDEELDRRVALKLIHPDHLFFEGSRGRFRREIEAVARCAVPAAAVAESWRWSGTRRHSSGSRCTWACRPGFHRGARRGQCRGVCRLPMLGSGCCCSEGRGGLNRGRNGSSGDWLQGWGLYP